ncbi:Pr6Pr family membrane protein [Roseinatronobacter alkalisoli]|uniref:Pr6Pr family membrane protein n=1 Tax=Roseinatronobacter alkalisoli TaxID=3028235 RepID=A0ABT5T444_9RHOB|nr:Pr6Pr family membrane protein [Roseinatronobacter sp. HJB301]MDD7969892.1 Pr6Pr family membrane protein [Roseinatronobacter sp. HJB301]
MDPKYRVVAGMIGTLALTALVAHLLLRMGSGGVFAALWRSGGYFTILTTALTAGTFLAIAIRGRRLSFGWMSMLTLSMIMVGLVYHVLLSHLFNPRGLHWWIDQAFHTVLPAAVLWFWLMEVTRHEPRTGARPLLWAIWPVCYGVYALLRGALTGWYPYPFLNVARLGWDGVLPNLAGVALVFVILAYGMNYIGQRMPLRD